MNERYTSFADYLSYGEKAYDIDYLPKEYICEQSRQEIMAKFTQLHNERRERERIEQKMINRIPKPKKFNVYEYNK